MAVDDAHDPVDVFKKWYTSYEISPRDGALEFRAVSQWGAQLWSRYEKYKREMDLRVGNYENLEKIAAAEVVSTKPDLPNVSSGEVAGLVRRIARSLVQNTPNVEVISIFDDDSIEGIFAKHVLTTKIIGSDEYSNDMQQNLFASTKGALTKGFDCVVPSLQQDGGGSWYMLYDTVNYRDVFPEPAAKDVRRATDVFVRRYLTKGEVELLIQNMTPGWDHNALTRLLKRERMGTQDQQSVARQTKKHHQIPEGYEIITWYNSFGEPFLTFSATTKMLLRIEKNKHPLKLHPVHFLVLEKDEQQPLGQSQVELVYGRQEFQDLFFNGAMKLWYRNINPAVLGYGMVNELPNLGPGKYTKISNPNAKLEPFEVNTQSLMQFGLISQQNAGAMNNMIGNADQQMAASAGAGMSATPQGVEAQQQMVDITTNNYQKAIESFFSHYCSYALTIYFQELKTVKKVKPTAEARLRLLKAGVKPYGYKNEEGDDTVHTCFNEDGTLDIDFEKMATEYFVRCVPGSLVELEDEKQLRILNQLFVPLSQAMPAMAATQDQAMLRQATQTMAYIIKKQIELSGSSSAKDIASYWEGGGEMVEAKDDAIAMMEERIGSIEAMRELEAEAAVEHQLQMRDQMALNTEALSLIMEKLGVPKQPSNESSNTSPPEGGTETGQPPNLYPASA